MGFLLSPFYPSHTYVSSPLQLILSKAASGPARLLSQPTLFTSPDGKHTSVTGGRWFQRSWKRIAAFSQWNTEQAVSLLLSVVDPPGCIAA